MAVNSDNQKSTLSSTLGRDYSEQDGFVSSVYNHGDREKVTNFGGDFNMQQLSSTKSDRSLLRKGLYGGFSSGRRSSQPCRGERWTRALDLIVSSLAKDYRSKAEGDRDVS